MLAGIVSTDRNFPGRFTFLLSVFFLLQILTGHVHAQLYSEQALKRIETVYGANIRGVLYEDVAPYLTTSEAESLFQITLTFPYPDPEYKSQKVGPRPPDVFGFSMNLDTGVMRLPLEAIKFFDDLALAFAWYEHQQKDPTPIAEYVVRLHAGNAPAGTPLSVLNVPEDAWKQSAYVDDVSQKTLKSGLTFLLLHELAHWHFNHQSYDEITHGAAQQQEAKADAFALDVMARMKTPPYGMVIWFLATSWVTSDRATTHPLSSDRLVAIAESLEERPSRFISFENRNTLKEADIRKLALDIRYIASQ